MMHESQGMYYIKGSYGRCILYRRISVALFSGAVCIFIYTCAPTAVFTCAIYFQTLLLLCRVSLSVCSGGASAHVIADDAAYPGLMARRERFALHGAAIVAPDCRLIETHERCLRLLIKLRPALSLSPPSAGTPGVFVKAPGGVVFCMRAQIAGGTCGAGALGATLIDSASPMVISLFDGRRISRLSRRGRVLNFSRRSLRRPFGADFVWRRPAVRRHSTPPYRVTGRFPRESEASREGRLIRNNPTRMSKRVLSAFPGANLANVVCGSVRRASGLPISPAARREGSMRSIRWPIASAITRCNKSSKLLDRASEKMKRRCVTSGASFRRRDGF